MQVLAIAQDEQAAPRDAERRTAARRRVRQVLAQAAGAELAAHLRESPREVPLPGPVSVSHETGLSLLAWCAQGCIGIDLVDTLPVRAMPHQALADTAALYLGSQWLAQAPGSPSDPVAARFAHAWARHEARLKCLGLGMQEWSADLQGLLSGCSAVPVTLAAMGGTDGPQRWVAWLAWVNRGA